MSRAVIMTEEQVKAIRDRVAATLTTEELARELEELGDPSGGVTHTLRDKDVVSVPFGTLRAAAARLRELEGVLKTARAWSLTRTGHRRIDYRRLDKILSAAQLTETRHDP